MTCISLDQISYRIGPPASPRGRPPKGVNGGWQDSRGYWMIRRGNKSFRAHRVMWEHHHGPIPEGLEILHLCHNTSCVNIDHLKVGTHAENMAMEGGERNHQAKLTCDQVREIRARYEAGGVTQKRLSREYGVSASNINWAIHRKSYQEVS